MRLDSTYPSGRIQRDHWILSRRGNRTLGDPFHPHGFFYEVERTEQGLAESVATILLTNRECPWRCLMCDLWKTTVLETVPSGAIPAQIDYALEKLRAQAGPVPLGLDFNASVRSRSCLPQRIKLYNGGSFFDPRAIPLEDYSTIIQRLDGFSRVTVECHPLFVGDACERFHEELESARNASSSGPAGVARLEVALGLETIQPEVLERLNKGMTLNQFAKAAEFLRVHRMAMRAFVLVQPPFCAPQESVAWAERSIRFAFDSGAEVVSLIPTRAGNGAMEELGRQGNYLPPTLRQIETAQARGIALQRGRVFADTWDLQAFSNCPVCFSSRQARIERMNLSQVIEGARPCSSCGVKPGGLDE